MITKTQAIELATKKVNEIGRMSNYKLALLDDITEFECGWMFFYQNEKFLATGDVNYMLGGNAPIIVDKFTSEIVVTGTNKSEEFYIDMYKKYRDDMKKFEEIIKQ